jgi:hypothetical protein
MDLNLWSQEQFPSKFWMSLKAALGAHRYRCEYCRLNFVRFRRRKEVFSFRRWDKLREEREAIAMATNPGAPK